MCIVVINTRVVFNTIVINNGQSNNVYYTKYCNYDNYFYHFASLSLTVVNCLEINETISTINENADIKILSAQENSNSYSQSQSLSYGGSNITFDNDGLVYGNFSNNNNKRYIFFIYC